MRLTRMVAATVLAGAAVVVPMATPASAGGGCHVGLGGERPTQATGDTVKLVGACMSPMVLRVEPGTDVTFVNRSEVSHNLYGASLRVSELAAGLSVSARFDEPGTYPHACTLHAGMVGAVVVGDGRFPTDIAAPQPVAPSTTTTAAPVPLAATRPLDASATSDSTALIVLVSVAFTLSVGAAGYGFGRRSAVLGAHDRADG